MECLNIFHVMFYYFTGESKFYYKHQFLCKKVKCGISQIRNINTGGNYDMTNDFAND